MSRIAVIGASGGIGNHLLREALTRGHQVTAVTRSNLPEPHPGLTSHRADLADTGTITDILRGQDAVLSAYSPGLSRIGADEAAVLIAAAHDSLFAAAKAAGVDRVIIVGGVGSLRAEQDKDGDVVDAPYYPGDHKAHTLRNREILRDLRAGKHDLDWTYVSPPLDIFEGPRTGVFRLGQDTLLRDAAGQSRISRADFATAILDAHDRGSHRRQRFTVAY